MLSGREALKGVAPGSKREWVRHSEEERGESELAGGCPAIRGDEKGIGSVLERRAKAS